MDTPWFEDWIGTTPLPVVGLSVLVGMFAAAGIGWWLRRRQETGRDLPDDGAGSKEGYIVSAVFGLMALLLGFTFALAVDRFDTRRERVLEAANAIETTYLRAQLLEEPHRRRVSDLLIAYTDNVIKLAEARPDATGQALLARDDQLLTDLWSASAAAFDSIRGVDFSSAYLDSMNQLIDSDAARRVARQAHVPGAVFAVLMVYLVMSAGVMGYVLWGPGGRVAAVFLLILMTLSLLLILDIDRPVGGRIRESQRPMIAALKSMSERPPGTFDRWRTATASSTP